MPRQSSNSKGVANLLECFATVGLLAMLVCSVWPGAQTEGGVGKPVAAQILAGPAILDDDWRVLSPSAAGFDADALGQRLTEMMASGDNLHAVIVERHGALVAEVYGKGMDKRANDLLSREVAFGPTVMHDTRSVGKSLIDLLVGIAIDEGKLSDVRTPAITLYPELNELSTPGRKAIALEHLLGMSSGLKWKEGGAGRDDEHGMMWARQPLRDVLSRDIVSPPGRVFNYNSGGTAVLADIVSRSTGMPWEVFAQRALFAPLGIRDVEWIRDFRGRPMAYTGLRLRPRDMAKIGRLVLDRGMWRGQRVVSTQWIDLSLTPKLRTGFDDTGYGYQWWTGHADVAGREVRWAAAFGNGGQRIFVVPELDMTVVVTAGAYGDMQAARRINAHFRRIVETVKVAG